MTRFPTAVHLVSWAKLCPRTIQSGPLIRGAKTGKGNPYLKGVLGEAAATVAKSDTFLGERHRRIVKRRGKLKALVAVARSILQFHENDQAPKTSSSSRGPCLPSSETPRSHRFRVTAPKVTTARTLRRAPITQLRQES